MNAVLEAPAVLSQSALDQLFVKARSHNAWLDQPIDSATLHQLYELTKWGPTAVNSTPLRVVFVQSDAAKARLLEGVLPMNQAKVKAAPVTAILAHDTAFYDHLGTLFPHMDAKPMFTTNPAMSAESGFRNGSLQAGYFILAARALGLDCGPMSGFNNAKVDELFLAGTTWKSNIICNLGYGDPSQLHPRLPRLSFDEACRIV